MLASLRYPNRILLTALTLGVCADRLFSGGWLGVSAPLFVGLCLLALGAFSLAEAKPATRANVWLGGAAFFFSLALMLRDTPLLVALNLLAVLGLLLLLVACYRGDALAHLPAGSILARVLLALVDMGVRPVQLTMQATSTVHIERQHTRRLVPIIRGLVLALPVLACFTGLLVAADSVFASYVSQIFRFQLPFDFGSFVGHTLFVLIVAWTCAGGLLVALFAEHRLVSWDASTEKLPAEGETQRLTPPRRSPLAILGAVEALVVLIAVDLLFGGFLLIQGAYFFGGLDTLDRTGMTYAEYARRGFFELLAVACLALGMLWTLAIITRREQPWQRQIFNSSSVTMIVLVLGLLASAFQRMLLYEQAYGYTELRLYTHSFMIWLALVLILFLFALLRDKPRIFTFGGFVSALIYLAALNLANPDALIVRENIARYQTTGKLDADYLGTLSADAIPTLMAALPTIDSASQFTIQETLGQRLRMLQKAETQGGWPGWHLSRLQAHAALESAGIVATQD